MLLRMRVWYLFWRSGDATEGLAERTSSKTGQTGFWSRDPGLVRANPSTAMVRRSWTTLHTATSCVLRRAALDSCCLSLSIEASDSLLVTTTNCCGRERKVVHSKNKRMVFFLYREGTSTYHLFMTKNV